MTTQNSVPSRQTAKVAGPGAPITQWPRRKVAAVAVKQEKVT
jgi:hypothetical protein